MICRSASVPSMALEIAAVIVCRRRKPGPGREAVGDANLLYGRNIRHANVEMAGTQGPGFDVIFDALGQAGEEKLEIRGAGLGMHGKRIPLQGTLVTRIDAH